MYMRCVVVLMALLGVGCESLPPEKDKSTVSARASVSPPSPKAKAKEPIYPKAEQLVQWHAQQCGGFADAQTTEVQYVGEPTLRQFFARLCVSGQTEPTKLISELEHISGQYYWPQSTARYFWLLKQQLIATNAQLQALATQQDEQKKLKKRMQETLASLAAIEQQLIQRDTSGEGDSGF